MSYLVEELWKKLQDDRPIAALARDIGIKREALSVVMWGKRGISKGEGKKIVRKFPELREQVVANLLDEDLGHRDYARTLEGPGCKIA